MRPLWCSSTTSYSNHNTWVFSFPFSENKVLPLNRQYHKNLKSGKRSASTPDFLCIPSYKHDSAINKFKFWYLFLNTNSNILLSLYFIMILYLYRFHSLSPQYNFQWSWNTTPREFCLSFLNTNLLKVHKYWFVCIQHETSTVCTYWITAYSWYCVL